MAFQPYLMFGGNCRDAFTRYKEIFGGELTLMTLADMPPGGDAGGQPIPPEKSHMIMHAALTHDGNVLMGSDDPTTDDFGPVQGMFVSCSVADAGEAKRVFDALAEGGQELMALAETFWSPAFGMCVDRFGTQWMVSAEPAAE